MPDLTADMGEVDLPLYDIRAALLEVDRKGRPLTEEELSRFVIDPDSADGETAH